MPKKKKEEQTALHVKEGVDQPSMVNPEVLRRLKEKRKKLLSAAEYIEGIRTGNRSILSRAITLVESSLPEHHQLAREIIEACLPLARRSVRLGITGVPGVGKSTFIESFGLALCGRGRKLAILAIDPSSERSHGSIMGDKTRMEQLSNAPNAFIRPSPTAGSLGGVARKTREAILLCEAAGFDTVFVETVGVGQSETAVHSMVDFFLLLMLAGAGDELQGIKRGIMEMADALVITKADGNNRSAAQRARAEYEQAMHLFPPSPSGWSPKAMICSSVSGEGIEEIWEMIEDYLRLSTENGFFTERRRKQAGYWMQETINERLLDSFKNDAGVKVEFEKLHKAVLQGEVSSFTAAGKLLNRYFKK